MYTRLWTCRPKLSCVATTHIQFIGANWRFHRFLNKARLHKQPSLNTLYCRLLGVNSPRYKFLWYLISNINASGLYCIAQLHLLIKSTWNFFWMPWNCKRCCNDCKLKAHQHNKLEDIKLVPLNFLIYFLLLIFLWIFNHSCEHICIQLRKKLTQSRIKLKFIANNLSKLVRGSNGQSQAVKRD